jgi:hypothetical protein
VGYSIDFSRKLKVQIVELEFVLLGGNGVERLGKALSKNGKKVKTVAMRGMEYRFQ